MLFAKHVSEEDFTQAFMTGRIRLYIDDKDSFINFCTLVSDTGSFKIANANSTREYEDVYDKQISGEGILFYLEESEYFDPNISRSYQVYNALDSNPHQKEEWKNVLYFRELLKKIYGPTADELNHKNQIKLAQEKEDINLLLKNHGGNTMSRRIGNFYDEKTGETHWLEPDTVKDYPLPPGRISEFGQSGYRTVNYVLSSNETDKTIELVASVELSNGQVAESDPVAMDELQFAEHLFDAYINDKTFANKEEIKSFSESSLSSLAVNAYKEHGIILNGLELAGFGSIYYDKDRVATFDSIKVSAEPYNNFARIELNDSVSQTTLVAEKNPSVSFISNGYELHIGTFAFRDIQSGVVTQYTIETETITTNPSAEENPLRHVYDDTVTPESPYMQERIALLASAELEEDVLEDRFGDIFQL